MIDKIVYTGVIDAASRTYNDTILVISILDFNSKHPRPAFDGCKDKLELSFKDRCEEEFGYTSAWPDRTTEKFNLNVLRQKGERLFDLSDAEKILDFFEKYYNADEYYELVIHCRAGVSRSSAVAAFLSEHFDVPFEGNGIEKRFRPNPRIIRIMTKAMKARK